MSSSSASAIDDLAERYVDRAAALDPCMATFIGITGHDEQMTDLSPDGFAARDELARRTLAEISGVPVAGEHDRIAAAAMSERIGSGAVGSPSFTTPG